MSRSAESNGHALNGGSRTYRSWKAMRRRVKYHPRYINVTVHPPWENFLTFLADMGERPPNTTLDRIDSKGNYEPANCRWADWYEQSSNRSNNIYHTVNGVTKTQAQWARQSGIAQDTLSLRLKTGKTIEQALRV